MSLHVTVQDEQTREVETVRVPDGEYFLLVTEPCHLHHVQAHANGTHVLTIKGRDPRPLPEVAANG